MRWPRSPKPKHAGGCWRRGLEGAAEKLAALVDNAVTIEPEERRARLQLSLGDALLALGQRESGTERLERAIDAYHGALEQYTRERAPLEWAATQHSLGGALQTLGARESGTERLEQAVDAYRASIQERTRERMPLDWAATQNNLGAALRSLGDRDGGTERLELARGRLPRRPRSTYP